MNSLVKIAVNIIEWLRAHRLPIVVVSAVIVMIVSYALVLPALTMTLDKALEQGGISLNAETETYEESEKQDSISPDDEAEDEIYEEADDQDSVSPDSEAEDEDHEEPEKKDGSSSDAEPEEETYAEPVQPVKKKGLRGGMSLMATEIPDSTSETLDVNKSYLICYEVNGTYYLLKNDGTTDSSHTPAEFEDLNSTYCWSFNYVFEEKHLEDTLTYVYYLIRPIDMKSKTLALNAETSETEPLVQRSNNNVAVVPAEGGGYNLIGYNNIKLNFENGKFSAKEFPEGNNGVTVHIYEMANLPTYSYLVRSADETRGTVTVDGGILVTENHGEEPDTHHYEAESDSNKKNKGTITATPVNHPDGEGDQKWLFDHWEQDGIRLDRDQYPETINAKTLPIPFNGSNLVAYFKQNKEYDVPDNEKDPTTIENLSDWLDHLTEKPVPIDQDATTKTAEVYDYENRIYRVDIESKADFKTFKGDVDMAFCMDVSNSMYFPASLKKAVLPNNHENPLPIYQINNSYWNNGWVDNRYWLDTSRGWDNPYYIIADNANTATVFKVYYRNGDWKAQDASRETESDRSFKIGDTFTTNWAGSGTHPFNAGDNDNTTYTIWDAGSNNNRFYYLNQAYMSATSDLNDIMNILAVAGDDSPDIRVAYNTFNKNLGSQRQDFRLVEPVTGINLANSAGGGTRPDQAFINAQTFNWQGDDRYVILITDGAPQGQRDDETDNNFDRISQAVLDAAQNLKDTIGVKFITVGLSLQDVPHGKKLLYDLADDDKDGNRMFFMAEKAEDLPNILRQVVKTVMDDAIVIGDVTDTIGEAFYPVDKKTGMPLKAGDKIDIEGCITTDPDKAAGVVQDDGVTIKWAGQAIDATIGWHGTVYVKAKEELLGGNGIKTNGDASVVATGYRMDNELYDFDDSLLGDKLKSLEVDFESPRVNVNELTFTKESSEWTVYLGTEVDPEKQIRQMYEDIIVTQVINEDDTLYYPLDPNSIADNKESDDLGNNNKTFKLAPEILKAIKANHDLSSLYVQDDDLNWDVFLRDIQKDSGVVVPYHLYGIEGDDSNITVKLTKTILGNEEGDLVNHSPHNTTELNNGNNPVEKYVLTVRYNPDYDHVLPAGQGGHGNYEFHSGSYGSMYQGHAAGREDSINQHVINVYKQTLDVLKTDNNNTKLKDAVFKLYQKDNVNGLDVDGLEGKYVEVASGTSGNDGIAHLESNTEDVLKTGITYYLVEDQAPQNYQKLDTVWSVQVQTEKGKYTDLKGNEIYPAAYPYNWDQGARILVDGNPVTVIAKDEQEGSTVQIDNGTFVSDKNAISYQYNIENSREEIEIFVNKTWVNQDNPPESISFDLYRVSEKGHKWGKATVVPCTCTEAGNKQYTCSVCGATKTEVLVKAGHMEGTPHKENEVKPTCEDPGGYDIVTRCKACGAIISTERVTVPETGHDWGEWVVTTPAQPGIAGIETRTCKNDPEHKETRAIDPLPLEHTVSISFKCVGNRNGGVDYQGQISDIASRVGTGIGDMTIQWDWNQYTLEQTFDVDGLLGGANETHSWSAEGAEYQSDGRGGRETLTIHNITRDLDITVTIHNNNYDGTNNGLIYQPSFAGLQNRNAKMFKGSLMGALGYQGPLMVKGLNDIKASGSEPTRGGDSTPSKTQAELTEYLGSIKSKNEVSCAETEQDHTYKELAGTYTITPDGDGHWTWSKDDLPKYNEYGNEYTYYVVETPLTGYNISYSGQDNGLNDDNGAVTITNEAIKHEIIIVKVDNTDNTKLLGGAIFDLYAGEDVKADGTPADGAEPIQSNLTTPSTGDDKGKISLGQLAPGTYYLFETKAPDEYDPLDAPVKIVISETTATLYQGTEPGQRVEPVTIAQNQATLHVTNSAGVELPLTGGPGTRIFMVLGSLLTLIAGILLIARWRYSRGF